MTKNETINHVEIRDLSRQLFDGQTRQSFLKIALQVSVITKTKAWTSGYHASVEPVRDSILHIDNAIGGVGIDRLLVPTSHGYTANLPIDERPIHRPLQYALGAILVTNWPRTAVQMSCQHIEGILKKKYEGIIPGIDHSPLGSIVRQIKSMELLGVETIQQLEKVAHILNIAKHEYGSDAIRIPNSLRRTESQVFNIHEAVTMYFICRKLGVQLLADY